MNAAYFRRMIDYTYWAHREVWGCIAELSDEQFTRPCDYSIGSLHQQVVHTMGAEWLWLQRMHGVSPDAFFEPDDFPTREAVRSRWDQVEGGWREFVGGLSDGDLEKPLIYTSINGRQRREHLLWEGVAQVINHATDHRAQMLALLHQVGGRTLAQDFIFYAWENRTT